MSAEISALLTQIEARFWKGHEEGCAGRWDTEGEWYGCNCAHDSAVEALETLGELARAAVPSEKPLRERGEITLGDGSAWAYRHYGWSNPSGTAIGIPYLPSRTNDHLPLSANDLRKIADVQAAFNGDEYERAN